MQQIFSFLLAFAGTWMKVNKILKLVKSIYLDGIFFFVIILCNYEDQISKLYANNIKFWNNCNGISIIICLVTKTWDVVAIIEGISLGIKLIMLIFIKNKEKNDQN